MLTAPFAALEQRVNTTVLTALSNALVRVGLGDAQVGIFDNDYASAHIGDAGMAAATPAVTVPTDGLPSPLVGAPVQVEYCGVTTWYRVAAHHPDGTGMSVLLLERTA
jgi:hypothetical protein